MRPAGHNVSSSRRARRLRTADRREGSRLRQASRRSGGEGRKGRETAGEVQHPQPTAALSAQADPRPGRTGSGLARQRTDAVR